MELETRRLLLRPLRDEDAHTLTTGLNNFNVSRNLSPVPFPYSLADAEAFIQVQRGFDARSRTQAITFKCAPDEVIGMVSYNVGNDCEFGYWLRECCWRLGIMTEAAQALVHHAFAVEGLDHLHSGYWNPISGRLLRGMGFEELGWKRQFSLAQNKEVDCIKLRLTRARWQSLQKESRAA